VQLVDEEDDASVALLDLIEHGFQSFFKFAAEFCARDERAHIEREHFAVFQVVRHVAAHDTKGKSLCDRCFADARLTDEHRVVLRLTRENANHAADLIVTPDHGVKFLVARKFHQVLPVLVQHVISILGVVGRHRSVPANDLQLLEKRFFRHFVSRKQFLDWLVCLF